MSTGCNGNNRNRLCGIILAVACLVLNAGPGRAEDAYPSNPIRMIVPYPPGGSSDDLGRIVAERLGHQLNSTIFVENRPGATTQVGTEAVAQAKPDGYTLLLAAGTAFTVLPNLRKLSFSIDNFEVIGGVASYIGVLAVNNSLPVKSFDEFIKYARARPRQTKLRFGRGRVGWQYSRRCACPRNENRHPACSVSRFGRRRYQRDCGAC